MSGYFFHRYFCFHNFKNTQFLILRSAPRRELFFSIERIEPLLALKESNPPNKSALTEQINALKASKIPKNEANIEKIKNLLLKILRDIKTEMAEQQLLGPVATAAIDCGQRNRIIVPRCRCIAKAGAHRRSSPASL